MLCINYFLIEQKKLLGQTHILLIKIKTVKILLICKYVYIHVFIYIISCVFYVS